MQNAPGGHSAILSTYIKLTFVLAVLSGRFTQVSLYTQKPTLNVNADVSIKAKC